MSDVATSGNTTNAKHSEAASELIQLVSFNLMTEEFALPIMDVREIIRITDVTPVPNAPCFVEGVINLRGQILPVVDLRARFNLQKKEEDDNTRIIVVEVNSNLIGLIVDSVSEVLRIPINSIAPPPQIVSSGIGAEYIKGIANHNESMIIQIDLKKVFSAEEMNDLSSI